MSVKIMSYVWDVPELKGSDKLVMLCLADFANEEGFCWPSVETIARKSGVSGSTVKAAIKKLTKAQWLTKKNQFKTIEGKSVRASNQYLLHVAKLRKRANEAVDHFKGTQSQQPDFERSDLEQTNLEHSELERSDSEQTDLERSDLEQTEYDVFNSQNLAGGRAKSDHKPSIDPPIDPPSKDLVPSELETAKPEDPVLFRIPIRGAPHEHLVTQSEVFEMRETYPAVDVHQQLKSMIAWCKANPTRQKTARGIRRFINSWLCSEQDKPRHNSPAATKPVKTDADELRSKIRLLEMDIDAENQHLVRVMNHGGTQAAIEASKNRIKRQSDERRALLDQLAESDSDGETIG